MDEKQRKCTEHLTVGQVEGGNEWEHAQNLLRDRVALEMQRSQLRMGG